MTTETEKHSSVTFLQHKENVPHQKIATGILRELVNSCHANAIITQREAAFISALYCTNKKSFVKL